jgi:hypothetical protein
MTTMTMPTTVERTSASHASSAYVDKPVSQLIPVLVAIVLLVVVGVGSMLISGPMH